MIYLIFFAILIATINFNKELIDNVKSDAKEQLEWHIAQFTQWIVIYGGIMLFTGSYWQTIIFALFYPHLYDIGLNLRRGLNILHSGKHDLPMWIKHVLLITGIILIMVKGL